jgi:hypothetical protein
VVSDTDRTAEHADVHEPVDPVVGANTEEVPGEPVHLPIELGEPFGREPDPVAELGGTREPEPAIESAIAALRHDRRGATQPQVEGHFGKVPPGGIEPPHAV